MSKEKKLSKVLDEIWKFYEADKQSLIEFFRSGYKHFHKQAKEKDADEMEKELNIKRESMGQLKSLIESSAQAKEEPSEAEMEEFVGKWRRKIHNEIGGHAFALSPLILEQMLKEYDKLRRG